MRRTALATTIDAAPAANADRSTPLGDTGDFACNGGVLDVPHERAARNHMTAGRRFV